MKSKELLKIREKVISVLGKLAKELDAEIYLFGSYAEGTYTLDSDVDIVVVSPVFEEMEYHDRYVYTRLRLPMDIGFDIIPLTPDEFRKLLDRAFYRDISRRWIKISEDSSVSINKD